MPDLFDGLAAVPVPDALARQAVIDRASRVLRPQHGLRRFDEIAAWLAGWQRTDTPEILRPLLLLAAGDHGVARRGVSAHSSEMTKAMTDAIRAGAASSTVMASVLGVTVRLVDAGVGAPTGDITVEAALDVERFTELVELGRDTVTELDTDLLLLGGLGIGNITAAAALSASMFGGDATDWVGPGADADVLERKVSAVERAVERVDPVPPTEALRQLGGAEFAVIAGACLEARMRSIPVVLDGFVVTSAVAPLAALRPGALDHCLAGHLSPEPGHRRLLDRLGLEPLLEFDMALGEGTGALAAFPLIRAAGPLVSDVATFEEWGLR